MNDLPKRVLTAVIALPLLLALLLYTPWGITAILALAAAGGVWEMVPLLTPTPHRPKRVPRITATLVAAALTTLFGISSTPFLAVTGVLAIPTLTFFLARSHKTPSPWLSAIASLAIVALPLSSLHCALQHSPEHATAFFSLVFLVTWFGDAGSYFVGKTLGRHKLAPSVSPNKTWEGALGGLLTAVVLGGVVHFFALDHLPLWNVLILCALTNIAGQCSDLFESSLKRARGVKDSGTMIPGYGGMLDKTDALLFAAPLSTILWILCT